MLQAIVEQFAADDVVGGRLGKLAASLPAENPITEPFGILDSRGTGRFPDLSPIDPDVPDFSAFEEGAWCRRKFMAWRILPWKTIADRSKHHCSQTRPAAPALQIAANLLILLVRMKGLEPSLSCPN